MEILPGKSIPRCWEKIGKSDFAPFEKYSSYATGYTGVTLNAKCASLAACGAVTGPSQSFETGASLFKLTLVLLRGGLYQPPLTVIALVLKIAQPRGKIAPGTFKFILSLHFSEKISNLPPTAGVG